MKCGFACLMAFAVISTYVLHIYTFETTQVSAGRSSQFLAYSSEDTSSPWSIAANMITARTDFTGAELNGKIYIIGGLKPSVNEDTIGIVEAYDVNQDRWEKAPSLPEPLNHAAAASYENKLYVVGGFYADGEPSGRLLIYDQATNKWQDGPPIPRAKGALTANFINGILYAVGGVEKSGVSPSNWAYDPNKRAWTERSPMPTAREHLTSAVVDGKLYAIGGRVGGWETNLSTNEMYDPETDSWTALEPMPSKRGGLAAASVNGTIYVFGGEGFEGTFENSEKYYPKTNKWSNELAMPTPRHGLVAIPLSNKIYVIGGGLEPGLSQSDVNEVFFVDENNTGTN
jgi:N-acetylneuraminic acid mutarotase